MLTLWDLLGKRKNGSAALAVAPAAPVPAPPRPAQTIPKSGASMSDRYEAMTRDMLRAHNVRVRKWRTSMSGCAWTVSYADGRVSRLIEAPRPKGPMSAAIFLHEIGHHAIGLGRYKPRCLEEYHAWRWSLEQMEACGLNITAGVRRRMHHSLYYAVYKAKRRGMQRLPPELAAFATRPRD